jgi:NAD(P)-dependent dehydrogenase (short-subunit alcohol dehydrogenase family)
MAKNLMAAVQRVAIVTGGSRGIGLAIAQQFATKGWCVATADVLEAPPEMAQKRESGQALHVTTDITSAADRANLQGAVMRGFGRIDCLVNNAGVAPAQRVDLLDATEDSYDRVMGINLKGPYFLTQVIAKTLVAQRSAPPPGYSPSIINITSVSAWTSSPSRGEYCLSKAGLSMVTKLYADRLAEHGIPVYEVQPGIIATPMTDGVKAKYDALFEQGITPLARWGQPDDVARAVVALADGDFPYCTGQAVCVDGGFHLRRL